MEKLDQARLDIESRMAAFKDFERDLKTKAFSTFALQKDEEETEEQRERREMYESLGTHVE